LHVCSLVQTEFLVAYVSVWHHMNFRSWSAKG
jgi:hypothetical protein